VELAVRWHHRLDYSHPFRNSNGRWSRLAADVLLHSGGLRLLSWGRTSLAVDGKARKRYIEAIRLADKGEMGALISFAQS
jgi:Fic family protein